MKFAKLLLEIQKLFPKRLHCKKRILNSDATKVKSLI